MRAFVGSPGRRNLRRIARVFPWCTSAVGGIST